jgi:hypothetical protein
VAETLEEASQLIEARFEYMGKIHRSEFSRKRKSGQFNDKVVTFAHNG